MPEQPNQPSRPFPSEYGPEQVPSPMLHGDLTGGVTWDAHLAMGAERTAVLDRAAAEAAAGPQSSVLDRRRRVMKQDFPPFETFYKELVANDSQAWYWYGNQGWMLDRLTYYPKAGTTAGNVTSFLLTFGQYSFTFPVDLQNEMNFQMPIQGPGPFTLSQVAAPNIVGVYIVRLVQYGADEVREVD